MPLTIPDEALRAAGLSEEGALIEFACRLFDAGKLSLWSGAKMAGLSRSAFEEELLARQIAIYRPTAADLREELEALAKLDRSDVSGRQ